MNIKKFRSWNNYPAITAHDVWRLEWYNQSVPFNTTRSDFICYGQGRSYGDTCLTQSGILLDTRRMNRFLSFDRTSGILRCEAGVTFSDILNVIVPQGWFLPVVAGTKYISVGGAIASDIHGKNHATAGTFGRHILGFELLRSDGHRYYCSPENNSGLFNATIGGLGLTGIITSADIQLAPLNSAWLDVEYLKFYSLEEFQHLHNDAEYSYTVAWLDCLNDANGRGIFMRARQSNKKKITQPGRKIFSVPCYLPSAILNSSAMRMFNSLYFHRQRPASTTVHYENFFFPLDRLHNWNKIYGKRGFLQYQCVVPEMNGVREILKRIVKSGQGSFLSVLKIFSALKSPGMLSFPRAGITLALDFPNRGKKIFDLLDELDCVVLDHGGRVYPAKDARMSGKTFRHYYPEWENFQRYRDPRFNSHFWQRVMGD